jgi:hypothetical protein
MTRLVPVRKTYTSGPGRRFPRVLENGKVFWSFCDFSATFASVAFAPRARTAQLPADVRSQINEVLPVASFSLSCSYSLLCLSSLCLSLVLISCYKSRPVFVESESKQPSTLTTPHDQSPWATQIASKGS